VEAKHLLKDIAGSSDNLVNFIEIPVLFYVALFILGSDSLSVQNWRVKAVDGRHLAG
jgi:hypothetical protein